MWGMPWRPAQLSPTLLLPHPREALHNTPTLNPAANPPGDSQGEAFQPSPASGNLVEDHVRYWGISLDAALGNTRGPQGTRYARSVRCMGQSRAE